VKRTILFLNSSSGSFGSDRQLVMMIRALDPERYAAAAVIPGPGNGPLKAELQAAGARVFERRLAVLLKHDLSGRGVARMVRALGADARAIRRIGRMVGADVVHTNTAITLGGPAGARALGVPHVWHLRENFSNWPRLWPLHRRYLATADAIVSVSDATSEPLGGLRQARRIYDGFVPVEDARVPSAGQAAEIRRRLGIDPTVPVVTLVGRISPYKGQAVLVEALAKPVLAEIGAVGVFAGGTAPGDAPVAEGLEARAAELGLGDRARFIGHWSDVPGLLRASDVVVVPSTWPDPLPNSAIEAASLGCAIVASRIGGLPEIIDEDVTGLLVDPGDPDRLAAATRELISDPDRRRRIGAAASADVHAKFGVERLGRELDALYGELLSGTAPR
jgi:hypothetical protein